MGGTGRIKREAAQVVADAVVHYFAPFCERIEIAGSIRRQRPDVGDIEIVAIPKLKQSTDMFGSPYGPSFDRIDEALDAANQHETPWLSPVTMGHRYWKIIDSRVPVGAGYLQIDLFLVRPPAEWGVILAQRTGPAEFSKKLMVGLRSRDLRSDGGRILDKRGRHVPCPEEQDLFKAAGVTWIPPNRRG